MAFQSKGGGALNEINITPLVDVMLVLLVVFMVTTPIIAEEMVQRQVEIDLPTTNAKPITKSEMKTRIILAVMNQKFQVNLDMGQGLSPIGEGCDPLTLSPACLDSVESYLKQHPTLKRDELIFFLADRSIPYGFVVDVMSRIKRVGYTKLALVTNPTPNASQ